MTQDEKTVVRKSSLDTLIGSRVGGARPDSSQNDSEDARAEASRKIELSTEETKSRSD